MSSAVLDDLRAACPGVEFLPQGVSNVQLARAGMACGVTVYGTVAHELAYLGVPSIACARHPHHAFDFCRTARSRDQYAAFLASPRVQPLEPQAMRAQALQFYYMHNLHGDAAQRSLRSDFVAFWKLCQAPASPDEDLLQAFQRLRESDAFKAYVRALR